MQPLPSDLWPDVFSFLPTPDLCVSCFTSKTLRDAAHKTINSRIPNHSNWWRHKKQLPAYSREVVTWWMNNVREPTWKEARDAAQRDDVDMVDLIGWDNTRTSPRHRHLFKPRWNRAMLLVEAMAKGNKRMINAGHQKGDISQYSSFVASKVDVWQKLGEEGNLEDFSRGWYDCVRNAAKAGHKHVILWLKERGIDERVADDLYRGAAEGGRSDVITWLRDHAIHLDVTREAVPLSTFAGLLDLFEWALRHNVPDVALKPVYLAALETGCIEPSCCEQTASSLSAIQLAIDHGYLTRQARIRFESISRQLELIKWLHARNVLPEKLSVYNRMTSFLMTSDSCTMANLDDHLDVLQWAAEKGYFTGMDDDHGIHRKASVETIEWLMKTFSTEETEMYRSLASHGCCRFIAETKRVSRRVTTDWNIEPMEWLLQRKWKKSEEEVQRWFQKEEKNITEKWLMHLIKIEAPPGLETDSTACLTWINSTTTESTSGPTLVEIEERSSMSIASVSTKHGFKWSRRSVRGLRSYLNPYTYLINDN
ncbi:hypothetical protein PROFUN_12966 [Planoprotostelium fungivorum]|uniref:F-box domain-containing protein n=1 Tax=Planoprotostelium fungivorum TaxID=1890364 RepID=A0A2P6MZH6_9EUKA|nr:hypothetical protein PROFUN_12966 [Planoprotostelium fungivorum]